MSLARFSIIVAIDKNGGIARDGCIPWYSSADMKYFKTTTTGNKKNAVIMGRKTYETIPQDYRPLADRHCVVVSETWKQADFTDITIYSSLLSALEGVGQSMQNYDEVFIIGGEQIYNVAVRDFLYLCDKIHVTVFKDGYDCDQFFPWNQVRNFTQYKDRSITQEFTRFIFAPSIRHSEYNYLDLLERVRDHGEIKSDRTGTGTISKFGERLEFDISERIPVLTTKKMFPINALKELLFFVSGSSDTTILQEQGVDWWSGNTSRTFIENRGLNYDEGDMGPMYGHQWRHYGAEYRGCKEDYTGEGIDQLSLLIQRIKTNPQSRDLLLTAWNVSDLDKMVLAPCHNQVQFYVNGDGRYLDCHLYMRSADLFLGVPYNIVCYSVLTHMIAKLTALQPRRFILTMGDAHIYKNHLEQVNKQLKRMPKPFPTLKIRGSQNTIDDFKLEDFEFENYYSWSIISAKMAV